MFTPLAGGAFAAMYHVNPGGGGTFLGIPINDIHTN
jgi:hypothetical protein